MYSQQHPTTSIRPLPGYLIDQIKAGEVIERPASLIKEILENSLDAHGKTVNLTIEKGGLDLIAIEDDGHGMSYEDLPFAFERHSTSKISKFEDLYQLHSFGFRGEALASISSVSRLKCTTRPLSGGSGGQITIEGGKRLSLLPLSPHTGRFGTFLAIRDLFYNTPARLKFTKSKTVEKVAIKKVLFSFLINHPEVAFTIKWDDREKEVYPALSKGQIEKRIRQIFFTKKSSRNSSDSSLLEVHHSFGHYFVHGYVSSQSSPGHSNKNQFLSVNGRTFTCRSLHTAVLRAMPPLWPEGHTGPYAICLTVPKNEMDVNVHPNKMQVKFEDNALLFSLITMAIKNALEGEREKGRKKKGKGKKRRRSGR